MLLHNKVSGNNPSIMEPLSSEPTVVGPGRIMPSEGLRWADSGLIPQRDPQVTAWADFPVQTISS